MVDQDTLKELNDFAEHWITNPFLEGKIPARALSARDLQKRFGQQLSEIVRESLDQLIELPGEAGQETAMTIALGYGVRQCLENDSSWHRCLSPNTTMTFLEKGWNIHSAVQAAHRCYKQLEGSGNEKLIAGKGEPIKRLKRDIWSACFGRGLNVAVKYRDLLRRESVLILGETGTGKENIARIIASAFLPEKGTESAPYYIINTTAIPDNLVESELFGHVKGAFTGADKEKKGLIQEADGGVLFLDEIGDLLAPLQPKLLRAMESGEIRKVGSTQTQTVEVKFIAATNRPLQKMVEDGSFRADLYYRLSSIIITPPTLEMLSDEDICLIAQHHIPSEHRAEFGAIQHLLIDSRHNKNWRGNFRELRNEAWNLMLRGRGNSYAPPTKTSEPVSRNSQVPLEVQKGHWPLKKVKSWYIDKVIVAHDDNLSAAAKTLGVSRETLYKRRKTQEQTP